MSDAVDTFLKDKDPHGSELLRRVRTLAMEAGPNVRERVSRSLVGWSAKRSFATAYVKGRYLELSIDLRQEIAHPRLRAAFATSAAVITHRFTFGPDHRVDARIGALLKEAHDTVGPGGRAPKP
jgi:hypothetical protein